MEKRVRGEFLKDTACFISGLNYTLAQNKISNLFIVYNAIMTYLAAISHKLFHDSWFILITN